MYYAKQTRKVLIAFSQIVVLAPVMPVVGLMWCCGLLDESQVWSISMFGSK